jgi:hypothetical protein
MGACSISRIPILCLLTILLPALAGAQPAQILLIRHGEKPPEKAAVHLSLKGRERAMALVPFLTETPDLLRSGLPVALFATRIAPDDPSHRTHETIQPLAQSLKLPIQAPQVNREYSQLAQEILTRPEYQGKTVLICWDHTYIPQLAGALGVKPQPPRWHGAVFDRVFIISPTGAGAATLIDLPQRLLFGDSPD